MEIWAPFTILAWGVKSLDLALGDYFIGFAESLHIAFRRITEKTLILSVEVRCVAITYAQGCTRRIEIFAQHQATCLLQSQAFLELQWAHRRDGLEVVVQSRDAHAQLLRQPVGCVQD